MKVFHLRTRKGNIVKNQFILTDDQGNTYFQSYNSIIAKKTPTKTFLDLIYWNYSYTTSKYRNIFLNETTQETQQKINSGEYTLTNLNK